MNAIWRKAFGHLFTRDCSRGGRPPKCSLDEFAELLVGRALTWGEWRNAAFEQFDILGKCTFSLRVNSLLKSKKVIRVTYVSGSYPRYALVGGAA